MQIKSVALNNFMSYENQVFDDFNGPGLVLLEGVNSDEGDSNGSGKSVIWDAVSWAIFGQTVRGLKGDDVIRRAVKADCSVKLHLEHRGKYFIIERHRKHSVFNNRLLVRDVSGGIKEEKMIELGTAALTQQWILDNLDIDFELFRCTILFAQGETFNFVNAGNKSQKEILSKVMRLDFEKYLSKTKENMKELLSEKSEMDRQLSVLESHVVENPEDEYKKDLEDFESNRNSKVTSLKKDREEMGHKIINLKKELKDFEDVTDFRDKANVTYEKIKAKIDDLRAESSKNYGTASAYLEQIKKFKSLGTRCPTCEQPVDSKVVMAKCEEISKMRVDLMDQNTLIQGQSDIWVNKLKAIRDKIDEADDKLLDKRNLEGRLETAMDAFKDLGRYIDEHMAEVNPFMAKMEEAIKKQKEIKDKVAKVKSELSEIASIEPYILFWQNAFGDSGIKSFVFDLVCSSLTAKANKYLNILTNGTVTIKFDTQKELKSGETREKFDCIVSCGGDSVLYDSYSGGEKRRISLAVDMSLAELMSDYYGSDFNIMVFDEQTDGLDKSGRISFMNLLKDIAKTKKVFVTDHDAEFKAMFDDVWVIEKRGGISRYAS